MKKHRNFLIFYGLWLAAITGIFVAFDEQEPKSHLKTDNQDCSLKHKYSAHSKTTATNTKICRQKNL